MTPIQIKTVQDSFARIAPDRDYVAPLSYEARGYFYLKGLIEFVVALLILPVALVLMVICALAIDFSGLMEASGLSSRRISAI